jgi:hypothetical protein
MHMFNAVLVLALIASTLLAAPLPMNAGGAFEGEEENVVAYEDDDAVAYGSPPANQFIVPADQPPALRRRVPGERPAPESPIQEYGFDAADADEVEDVPEAEDAPEAENAPEEPLPAWIAHFQNAQAAQQPVQRVLFPVAEEPAYLRTPEKMAPLRRTYSDQF